MSLGEGAQGISVKQTLRFCQKKSSYEDRRTLGAAAAEALPRCVCCAEVARRAANHDQRRRLGRW